MTNAFDLLKEWRNWYLESLGEFTYVLDQNSLLARTENFLKKQNEPRRKLSRYND